MDRSEAIRVIKELLADRDNDSRYPCVSSPRHYEALDLAIEALQEPEIVRCGECKRSSENGKIGCVLNSFDNHQVHLYANDYCSRGTKKQVPKPYESEGE